MSDRSLVHFKCQALQNSSKSFCKETSGVFYLMEKHPWDRGICLLMTCKTTPITWEATTLCSQITNAGLGAVSDAWPSSSKEFKLPKAIERRRKRRRVWIRFSFLLFAIKWLLGWATHSHWQTRQDGLNRGRQKLSRRTWPARGSAAIISFTKGRTRGCGRGQGVSKPWFLM